MTGMPWYIYLVAAGVVAALALAFHRADDRGRKTVEFIGIAIGIVIALLQLQAATLQAGGVMRQVQQAGAQSQEDVQHRRLDVSFQLMTKWNEPDVTEAARILKHVADSARVQAPAQILAVLSKDEAKGQAFQKIFDLFENVGLAVHAGYADDATLCLYFQKVVEIYYGTFEDYVRAQRPLKPGAYEQFEWLYDRWKKACPNLSPTSS